MQYTTLMRGNYLQSSLCAGLQIFTRKLIFSRLILQPAIWESFYLRSHSFGLLWRRTLSRSFPEKPKLRDRIQGSRLLMQMHVHTLSSYLDYHQRYSPQNQNFQPREQERETVLSSRGGKTWSADSTWLYSLAEPNPNTHVRQTWLALSKKPTVRQCDLVSLLINTTHWYRKRPHSFGCWCMLSSRDGSEGKIKDWLKYA